MKYFLIGGVVIGVVGVLALVYPMFGNQYAQPISAEQRWKEKIAHCDEFTLPKNVKAEVSNLDIS